MSDVPSSLDFIKEPSVMFCGFSSCVLNAALVVQCSGYMAITSVALSVLSTCCGLLSAYVVSEDSERMAKIVENGCFFSYVAANVFSFFTFVVAAYSLSLTALLPLISLAASAFFMFKILSDEDDDSDDSVNNRYWYALLTNLLSVIAIVLLLVSKFVL